MDEIEKNNDPLEDFFRKNLEDYNIPYNERDWEKLEKRLDAADAGAVSQPWMKWAAAAAILLACLLGYFIYENYNSINQINDQLASENPSVAEENQSPELSEKNKQHQPEPEGDTEPKRNFAADQPANLNSSNKVVDDRRNSQMPTVDIERVSDWECVQCQSVSSNVEQVSLALMDQQPVSSGNNANQPSQFAGRVAAALPHSSLAVAGVSPNIRLGLVVGPDLSTAGSLSNFEQPGYKLGVSADVFLGPRFAVSTGIIHSNVRYTARGREYQFPPGNVADGIVAQKTFAECAILEIPLALRYQVKDFSRSGLFVSAGLSSYIMLNENYQFTYADQYSYNDEAVREWSTHSGRAHIFSNARISAGYEQAFNNHLGVQIQPYLNIPLSGVGAGNVELYSVGMLFSFNYRLR